jgi:ATP-dependent exoDNAse (exonuclease V) alpha subunit
MIFLLLATSHHVVSMIGSKYASVAQLIQSTTKQLYQALPSPITNLYDMIFQQSNDYLLKPMIIHHQPEEEEQEIDYTKNAILQVKDSIRARSQVTNYDLSRIQSDIQKAGWYCATKNFENSNVLALRLKSLAKSMDEIKDPLASWNAYRTNSLNSMVSDTKYFVSLYQNGDEEALITLKELLRHANESLTVEMKKLKSIIDNLRHINTGLLDVMDLLTDQQKKQEAKWFSQYKQQLAKFGETLVFLIIHSNKQIDTLRNEEKLVDELLRSINFKRSGVLSGKRIAYAIRELTDEIGVVESNKRLPPAVS